MNKSVALFTMALLSLSIYAQADPTTETSIDEARIDSEFASLDNNRDMKVSQEEADVHNLSEYFAHIDYNGDRYLTKEEFKRYIKDQPK